jgi:penicillin-binding protein 1A
VEFPDGKSESFGKDKGNRVMTDGQAYEVTKILKMNVQSGTGTAAGYGCPAAGKTGTTDNFTDAWFVGYQPRLSAAVWVGYPNSTQIQMRSVHGISVAGGTFPAMIWHDFMNVAHRGYCDDFPQPSTPAVWVPFYGKYSRQGAPGDPSNTYGTYLNQDGTKTDEKKKDEKNGAKEYDPRLYEAPPQEEPQTTTPTEQPGNGNGNGNGNGQQTDGTDGGGAAPPDATGQTTG